MKKNFLIRTAAALAYLGMVAVNYLANALPINGITTGEVSDSYPNLFAPAGLTFAIWGLIYLLLGLYTVYQFGFFQPDKGAGKEVLFNRIGLYFIITSLINITWIFAWHYRLIPLTVVLMIGLLYFLIRISDALNKEALGPKDQLFISIPFRVYFGWITVATIANISVFLVSLNWGGFGIADYVWTVIALIIGTAIGYLRLLKDKCPAYGLVLAWAYSGIILKHVSASGFDGEYPSVIMTASACAIFFLAASGYAYVLKTRPKFERTK